MKPNQPVSRALNGTIDPAAAAGTLTSEITRPDNGGGYGARSGTAGAEDRGIQMKQEVFLPEDYRPAEDEPFMNERQLEYFRRKLLDWKADILNGSRETLEGLQEGGRNIPDIADRASEETDRALELRTRDRQRKLVAKIDAALRRIENGEYGYCDVTGEPISLRRLDARPIATMTLEAQERHERRERVHRDD